MIGPKVMSKHAKKTPSLKGKTDNLDIKIGERIRFRRIWLGMTQQEISSKIGVSIQQIQKYETGNNRVAGSRLYRIAQALKTNVGYFFGDYTYNNQDSNSHTISHSLNDNSSEYTAESLSGSNIKEIAVFLKLFKDISNPEIKKKILELIRKLLELMKLMNQHQ